MIHVSDFWESPLETRGESPTFEQRLRVYSTDPTGDRFTREIAYSTASNWVYRNRPTWAPDLRLHSLTCEPVNVGDIYEFTAGWSKWKSKKPKYQSTTTGGTVRVRFGEDMESAGAVDGPEPPDHHGGIGFQDGVYQGVDITVPAFSWSWECCYPYSFYTRDYRKLLYLYTGKVNLTPYEDFDAGEVMFMGATVASEEEIAPETGQQQNFWRIQFHFVASPNLTELTNNGTLKPISKKGHEAYWIMTAPAIGRTKTESPSGQGDITNFMIQKPVAHYAVRVAKEVELNVLQVQTLF